MKTYQVYAIAHVEVHIGEVEAEDSKDAWKKAEAVFKEQSGKPIRRGSLYEDPTIEELNAVVHEP